MHFTLSFLNKIGICMNIYVCYVHSNFCFLRDCLIFIIHYIVGCSVMLLFIIYLLLATSYIWSCAMVMMIQSTSYFVNFHMQGSEQGPMFCRNVDLFPFRQISGS